MPLQPRPRAGPLQELPLESFAPVASTSTSSTDTGSGPSTPSSSRKRRSEEPLLPAKRRILHQEGIFLPSKPVKSPVRDHHTVMWSRSAARHFEAVLIGSDSPARRLDFGPPEPDPEKYLAGLHTAPAVSPVIPPVMPSTRQSSPTTSSRLSPSLEIIPPSPRPSAASTPTDMRSSHCPMTSSTPSHVTPKPSLPAIGEWGFAEEHAWLPLAMPQIPESFASAIPRVPRAWSQHNPGFTIYRDPITVQERAEIDTSTPLQIIPNRETDGDLDKENLIPRCPSQKYHLTSNHGHAKQSEAEQNSMG
ncbi:hypothetical protein PUNSTDRAFT_125518 [Punctularia strigosozonata HHB-11173 SS5]|uniref:uncharacterized protein n=1 Tax=Punctularia strigosozonata (strain HHB-11173) TaxID=741275 RepID=UPI0004418004|nr:uncharacterized protein PUNSTDRAFT_125518 [Punctularia strigosozonata HHB-11173 SS5]EIN10871.1 hypothetical protein PUNSTDRAFT_125518 [Punctularia strigosozonata HHB-11173 SS5]